jgi:hypothetical protein
MARMAAVKRLKKSDVARKLEQRYFYIVLYQVVERDGGIGDGFTTFGSQLNKLSEREIEKLVKDDLDLAAKVKITTIIEMDLVN